MPTASGSGGGAGAWEDHDGVMFAQPDPVQNQWYTVFHDYNVRLLWCTITQTNDEAGAKTVEITWTIDGNVYFYTDSYVSGTQYYIYKDATPSLGGTSGLARSTNVLNAAHYVDKRGLDFQIDVRITDAGGTNQVLGVLAVYETAAPRI
jgi:hypothetical protein